MAKIRKVNYVYETKDYSIFKFKKNNRSITDNKKLHAEIKALGILNPIIVNEKYEVIDGQHRLEAAKKLGKRVPFIIKAGYGSREIESLNTTPRQWTIRDFVEKFANESNEEYIKMRDLMNHYRILVGPLCSLAFNSLENHHTLEKVKSGQLKFFNHEALVEYLEFYQDVIDKTGLPNSSTLPRALYGMYRLKKFDPNRIYDKANIMKENLRGITQLTVATNVILECYNKNLRKNSANEIRYAINGKGGIQYLEELKPQFEKK